MRWVASPPTFDISVLDGCQAARSNESVGEGVRLRCLWGGGHVAMLASNRRMENFLPAEYMELML